MTGARTKAVTGILIERNFTQFVVFAEDSILSALSKITANQSRLIFVVSESGILQGVLTDGDFRRWIASCGEIDLNRPVTAAMNPQCRSAAEGTATTELAAQLNSRIIALPWLDTHGRSVAVALRGKAYENDELKQKFREQDLREEARKVGKYRHTAKQQEQIITRMEQLMAASLRDARGAKARAGELEQARRALRWHLPASR